MGLKVCVCGGGGGVGGHKHTIVPNQKRVWGGGAHAPLATPTPLPTPVIYILKVQMFVYSIRHNLYLTKSRDDNFNIYHSHCKLDCYSVLVILVTFNSWLLTMISLGQTKTFRQAYKIVMFFYLGYYCLCTGVFVIILMFEGPNTFYLRLYGKYILKVRSDSEQVSPTVSKQNNSNNIILPD